MQLPIARSWNTIGLENEIWILRNFIYWELLLDFRLGAESNQAMPGNIRSGFIDFRSIQLSYSVIVWNSMTLAGFEPATKSSEVSGSFNTSHRMIQRGNKIPQYLFFSPRLQKLPRSTTPIDSIRPWQLFSFHCSQLPALYIPRKDYIYWIYDPSDSWAIGCNQAQGRLRISHSKWFMTQHGINLPRSRTIFVGSVLADRDSTFLFNTRF